MIATFPVEDMGKKVAEQALDEYLINGKSLREWISVLSDELTMLDKIRAEIQGLRNCSCSCSDGIIDDVEDIIDKYTAESEG